MSEDLVKAAIKVGEGIDLNINTEIVKAFRAITVKELQHYIENNADLHILIIGKVYDYEYSRLKEVLNAFKNRDSKNNVFFYVKNNDDELTSGLADELGCDTYFSREDLFRVIDNIYNVYIGVSLDFSKRDKAEGRTGVLEEVFEIAENVEDTEAVKTIEIKQTDEIADTEKDGEIDGVDEGAVKELREELKAKEAEIANLTDRLNKLNSEKRFLNNELRQVNLRLQYLNNINEQLRNEKDGLKRLISEVKEALGAESTEKEHIFSAIESLKDRVNTLSTKILENEKDKVVIEGLRSQVEDLEKKLSIEAHNKTGIIEELDKANKRIEDLTRIIADKEKELTKLKHELEDKITEINRLETLIKSKDVQISVLESRIKVLESDNTEKSETILKLNNEIKSLKEQYEDVDLTIEKIKREANERIEELKTENIQIKTNLDLISSQLREKEERYNELIRIVGVDGSGINTLKETNDTLVDINNNLRKELLNSKNEIERLKEERDELDKRVKELEEANSKLNNTIRAMAFSVAGGENKIPNFSYNQNGKIIIVFGSGSFGITTTAMSIAYKLAEQHKVLFIDFDFVMPKADIWFRENPVISELRNEGLKEPALTALGILLEKGTNYFIEHFNILAKRVFSSRSGSLDYLSGLYYRPDGMKFITVDYDKLFNYLGERYEYIVIDFGRLGCSSIYDEVIRVISEACHKKVVVTNNDRLEVRTFFIKMTEANITKAKTVWLLNMCTTTSVDQKLIEYINPAEFSIMLYSESARNNKLAYHKDRSLRGRFEEFMNKVIK